MREQKAKEYLRTIFALEMEGPVRGAYIAREMSVTKATVSVALKALEEEGYLRREKDHSVSLTDTGRHLARESIHQTVTKGRDYHELVRHLQAQEQGEQVDEAVIREHRLRWLEKEHAAEILEAHVILGKRYYCVRVVDLAHFLGQASGSVRARLRRLEHSGYIRIGEDTVVTLTTLGQEMADSIYARHATLRESLRNGGLSEGEAAQRAACQSGNSD